jgi:hypothetical protein
MNFARLEARGEAIAGRAETDVVARIIRRSALPDDIIVTETDGGVAIAGPRLRRRIIIDPQLRNFAHE